MTSLLILSLLIWSLIVCAQNNIDFNATVLNITADIRPIRIKLLPFSPDDSFLLRAPAVAPSPVVLALIARINMNRVRRRVNRLASYPDRHYQSVSGLNAARWLQAQLNSFASSCQMTVTRVNHSWSQFSLIASINSNANTSITTPVLVFGSHFDTLRSGRGMPGADDNASGTVTSLEALQLLCQAKTKTVGPVEFHYYSAEEVGLLGSTQIARQYKAADRQLRGYVNFDMTGVSRGGGAKRMSFFRDYTNPALTRAVKQLAVTYTGLKTYDGVCGAPCSDNYPWSRAGYAAVWPFEGGYNPFYNTPLDRVQLLDFDHMREFIKLALAAAVTI